MLQINSLHQKSKHRNGVEHSVHVWKGRWTTVSLHSLRSSWNRGIGTRLIRIEKFAISSRSRENKSYISKKKKKKKIGLDTVLHAGFLMVTWKTRKRNAILLDSFATIGIGVVLVGASGSRHKDSQPQTKGLTNRQPRPQEERSRGPTPTILWHVFQYLVIMTFRRPFRPKSPRRIGN